MKTYNLFISHSWTYSDDYLGLIRLLRDEAYFSFKDYSVSKDDPIHTRGTDRELQEAISNKIRLCHVVLVNAGVYASYSKWIDKEIRIARAEFNNPKPVIAVRPRGSERISALAKQYADRTVYWSTESIVSAIRELA